MSSSSSGRWGRIHRRHTEIRRAEEDHLLVTVARGRVQAPDALDGAWHAARFLLALARRGGFGRLAGVDAARRDFPQLALDRRAILPDQHHAPVLVERDDDNGGRVPHDCHLVLLAVREALFRDLDGEDARFENDGHID